MRDPWCGIRGCGIAVGVTDSDARDIAAFLYTLR
jgi:hypothetical protein